MASTRAQMDKSLDGAKRLRSEKAAPYAFLGSNEATYGLREGGAGLHRNRPAAGKTRPTLSAGIVRRVRTVRIAEADGRAGAHRSVIKPSCSISRDDGSPGPR